MRAELPTITLNIPAYNEAARLPILLRSIRAQDYPQERIEVLVVDGGSTDETREVAEALGCTVLDNPARNAEIGKTIAAGHATGELHMYLDADMEWSHDSCVSQLVRPWLDEPGLAGSFPRFQVDPGDSAFSRFLSYDPLYRDPLMRYLSASIDSTIVGRRDDYALCSFTPGKVPILGIAVYRTEFVRQVVRESGEEWSWTDVDFAIACAERGLGPLAYVPSAGIYHRSAVTPRTYLAKVRRNVGDNYLRSVGRRRSSYVAWDRKRDVMRLALWVAYANSVLPPLAAAVARAVRRRDPALFYEAWATAVGTDYVLLRFLADPAGRALVLGALRSLARVPRLRTAAGERTAR